MRRFCIIVAAFDAALLVAIVAFGLSVQGAPLLWASAPSAYAAEAQDDSEVQENAEDALSDEEIDAVDEASELFSLAESVAQGFDEKADALADIADMLEATLDELAQLEQEREAYKTTRTTSTPLRDTALAQLEQAQDELSALEQTRVLDIVFGQVTLPELAARVKQLQQDADDAQATIAAEDETIDADDDELASYDEQIAACEQTVQETIASGNTVASALESADSTSRTYDSSAMESVSVLDEEKTDAQRIYDEADEIQQSHDSSRDVARDALDSWYCSVDEISGVESSLTFGTGDDFALTQEQFVEKWGAAIDAFYESYAQTAGFTPPLYGYGEVMAAYAYEYEIDPRLCAAVSIAESSGGQYCIKAHNAWGWGATDANTYANAYSWSSWEEAIEGWHKGMSESTTGLATAGSVSALGELYCSTPTWASTVTEQMDAISAIAEQQQQEAAETQDAESE